jgi:uncharacterized protein involved in exopolysaccharide biosynthesis
VKLGISEQDPLGQNSGGAANGEAIRRLESELAAVGTDYLKANTLLTEPQKLGRDRLTRSLWPASEDPVLAKLLNDQNAAKQALAKAQANYATEHPEVHQCQVVLTTIDEPIQSRADGILAGLRVKAGSLQAQEAELSKRLQAAKDAEVNKSLRHQSYYEARRVWENALRVRDAAALRLSQERVDANLPMSSLMEVVDRAEPSLQAVCPRRDLAVGVLALGLFACLSGTVLRLTAPARV